MSLFGSLNVASSGLRTQGDRIGVISENISNSDTVGYKSARAEFANLISNTVRNTADLGGARDINTQINERQGEIIPSETTTDIAISGDGFFTVKEEDLLDTDQLLFTRAGSFRADVNGDFRNASGFYLQGWQLDVDGELPDALQATPLEASTAISALRTVNVLELDETPVPTSQMTLRFKLDASETIYASTPAYDATDDTANMSSGSVVPQFNLPLNIIDNLGEVHNLTAGFLKTASNTWAVEIYSPDASDIAGGVAQISAGTLVFNGDGTLNSVSATLTQPPTITWSSAADPNTVTLNWGSAGPIFGTPGATVVGRSDGASQFDGSYELGAINQDGIQPGRLQRLDVSSDGYIISTYSTGETRRLYMIPVVKFIDPNQLDIQTGTVFSLSTRASDPQFLPPGTGGAGTLQGGALERSNVDESQQLTELVIAQRSYQFNSKLISRSDEMLQTLTQMLV